MTDNQNQHAVRSAFQKFQDAYTARNLAKLDDFMQFFVQDDSIEMIGIGAAKRAATEWFENDMKAIFDQKGLSPDEKLMEATHYGMRRLRERFKGLGHSWPFTFTAVLVKDEAEWRFHTLHWAMPVD